MIMIAANKSITMLKTVQGDVTYHQISRCDWLIMTFEKVCWVAASHRKFRTFMSNLPAVIWEGACTTTLISIQKRLACYRCSVSWGVSRKTRRRKKGGGVWDEELCRTTLLPRFSAFRACLVSFVLRPDVSFMIIHCIVTTTQTSMVNRQNGNNCFSLICFIAFCYNALTKQLITRCLVS